MSQRLIAKARKFAAEHRDRADQVRREMPPLSRSLSPLRRRLVARMHHHADTADLLDKLVDALSKTSDKGA